MIDWQTITVVFIILAALTYVVRRGWLRFRSMRGTGSNSSCASGCGNCGEEPQAINTPPIKVLVQINRSHAPSRRPTR